MTSFLAVVSMLPASCASHAALQGWGKIIQEQQELAKDKGFVHQKGEALLGGSFMDNLVVLLGSTVKYCEAWWVACRALICVGHAVVSRSPPV